MHPNNQINNFRRKYTVQLLALLRVILGVSLLYKGIQFIKNDALLTNIIGNEQSFIQIMWLNKLIPVAHLMSGVFIAIGCFTRWMSISQIPILIGAIFFIYIDKRVYLNAVELPFAIVVLILLTTFSIKGDGFFSVKSLIRKEKEIV
jgi:uncharacterized membrane protein YphA (DoxX/SURF4 family)